MRNKEKTPRQKVMAALKDLGELRELLGTAQAEAAKELDAQNNRFCADLAQRLRDGLPLIENLGHGDLPVKTLLLVDALRDAQELLRRLPATLAKVDAAGGFSYLDGNGGDDGNER